MSTRISLVLSLVLCVAASSFGVTDYSATWGNNIWSSTHSKITGVTTVTGGSDNIEMTISRKTSAGARELVEMDYTNSTDTLGFGSFYTITSSTTLDDVAYVGPDGSGGDLYYIGRYYGGRGHIEEWATVAGWGSEKFNYGSRVLGLDVTATGSNEVIEGLNRNGYLHNFTTGMTSVVSSGTSYFQGATSVGDLNGDGDEDFLFCSGPGPEGNEASFASDIWYMESDGVGGWGIDFLGLTSTATTFTGISNLGDIDGDGYLELALTRVSRNDMNYSWIDVLETDMVPEPATLVMLGLGCIGLLRRKK